MSWFFAFLSLACCLWMVASLLALKHFRCLPNMNDLSDVLPNKAPRLSVVICACNEESTIEAGLRSLFAQDYPNLELVVVNDRSTDATGQIINRLAKEFDGLVTVHLQSLPEGWLGKVHALQQGREHANGDWILFTDADIIFRAGMLRRAMAFALQHQIDHLTVLPRLMANGFWEHSFAATFQLFGMARLRLRPQGKLHSDDFMGIGAFNMVRRDALAQSDGFAWLKMEVIDDIGLGLVMQRAGHSTRLVLGSDWLWVTWYPNLSAMARGLEKNLYGALAAWRPHILLAKLAALIVWSLAPWLALAQAAHEPFLACLAVTSLLFTFAVSWFFAGILRLPRWTAVCSNFGHLLMVVLALRAAFLAHAHKGIDWRGTRYSLKSIKAGQRVFFS